NDVAVVGGIVERNGEARPALLAVEIGHDFAREIMTRDLERAAITVHVGVEIDVRLGRLALRRLRKRWRAKQNAERAECCAECSQIEHKSVPRPRESPAE